MAGTNVRPVTAVEAKQSLAGVGLFAGLTDDQRAAVAKRCRWRKYCVGEEVIGYADHTTDLFFVATGSARVTFFTKAGKQISFRDVCAGEFIGELAAIDGQTRSASVVALTDSLLATMSASAFWEIVAEHPPVQRALLEHLAHQVRFLTGRVIEYGALDVNGRIHAELLRMARAHMTGANTAEIAPVPTHAELAARVSTHREAVTRELNYLARADVIERHPGRMVIRDVAALAAMVAKVLGD